MEVVERDPIFIAEQMRSLRKRHGLTQDNLAEAAGLTTRTIEKLESGKHRPEEQTLRSIARALQIDVRVFVRPSPGEQERVSAELERAARKVVLVETRPIHTASDFLGNFDAQDAFRIDMSAVEDDAALGIAGALGDWIRDLGDVWVDCYPSQRIDYARQVAELCGQLRARGYGCYIGSHRQQQRYKDRPPLIFTVCTFSVQPKAATEGVRYALIHLEDGWETLEGDRHHWGDGLDNEPSN